MLQTCLPLPYCHRTTRVSAASCDTVLACTESANLLDPAAGSRDNFALEVPAALMVSATGKDSGWPGAE